MSNQNSLELVTKYYIVTCALTEAFNQSNTTEIQELINERDNIIMQLNGLDLNLECYEIIQLIEHEEKKHFEIFKHFKTNYYRELITHLKNKKATHLYNQMSFSASNIESS